MLPDDVYQLSIATKLPKNYLIPYQEGKVCSSCQWLCLGHVVSSMVMLGKCYMISFKCHAKRCEVLVCDGV